VNYLFPKECWQQLGSSPRLGFKGTTPDCGIGLIAWFWRAYAKGVILGHALSLNLKLINGTGNLFSSVRYTLFEGILISFILGIDGRLEQADFQLGQESGGTQSGF